jgi:tRNA threonylcarbamoyladenosine biosynthesis protein TsaB
MRILAIETSTEFCSVALWQDDMIVSRSEHVGQKHSERLIAMLDELLTTTGCRIKDMDCIAFGMGPGSFTGVRIACGTAQGMALGAALPVIGVCTLEALAETTGSHRVIAALDARMGEIYHGAYEMHDDGWHIVSEPRLCKPEDAPPVPGGDWLGAGSGFTVHNEALCKRYTGQLLDVDSNAVPVAAAVATLGAARFAEQGGIDASEALPLYLRDKVALKTGEREAAQALKFLRMRQMTHNDLMAVLAIEQAVQPFPWTSGNFSDALDSGYVCRVSESESGEIRGYAILLTAVDEAELLNIGVAATKQRKGLGRAILFDLLNLAREKNLIRVFLEVRRSNMAALALYRSSGFSEIGVRRAYYHNTEGHEDAITMAWQGKCNG